MQISAYLIWQCFIFIFLCKFEKTEKWLSHCSEINWGWWLYHFSTLVSFFVKCMDFCNTHLCCQNKFFSLIHWDKNCHFIPEDVVIIILFSLRLLTVFSELQINKKRIQNSPPMSLPLTVIRLQKSDGSLEMYAN